MRFYRRLLKKILRHRYRFHPELTIIIPFYNAGTYLERLLSHIVNTTNIKCEILCIDDGSEDDGASIVKRYSMVYGCIRLIRFEENRGLFLARQEGIKEARGDYIGFVDSDDMIEPGYFDMLYKAAVKGNFDIAVGQIINVNTKGERYLQVRCAEFPYDNAQMVDNKTLVSKYWRQRGRCYHFHVVWNKIYKASILKKALANTSKYTGHHVMLEDFVYSSLWFANIHSYVTVPEAEYFYQENEPLYSYELYIKQLEDIRAAFDFVENYVPSEFIDDFKEWKALYGRIWKRNIEVGKWEEGHYKKLISELKSIFGEEIGHISKWDDFYYEIAKIV